MILDCTSIDVLKMGEDGGIRSSFRELERWVAEVGRSGFGWGSDRWVVAV